MPLPNALKPSRIKVNIFPFSWEIDLREATDTSTVDERVARLDKVRADLTAAIGAVDDLKNEAVQRQTEVTKLKEVVQTLTADKDATEKILSVGEESFTKLIGKANSKGLWRGRIEGAVLGVVTSLVASGILLAVGVGGT